MKKTESSETFAPGDLTLLTYAVHMAETARSEPAKRLFREYADAELRRFESGRLPRAGGEKGCR